MVKTIGPWAAFRSGLVHALQQWRLGFVFYAATVLLAGLLLWPIERGLIDWIGHTLAAAELADGLDTWLIADTIRQLGQEGVNWGIFPLTLPLWPFFLSLPFTVLSAGALEIYAAAEQRINWRRFWQGLGRYAPSFILLLLLNIILLEGIGLLIIVAVALLGSFFSGIGMIITAAIGTALLVGLLLLIQWWLVYARVVGVVRQERHVLRMLGGSAAFLRRNMGPAAGLSLLNFSLSFVPTLFYLLLAWPMPTSWWMGRFLLLQLLVLGRVGTRLVRLSTEVRLVKDRNDSLD